MVSIEGEIIPYKTKIKPNDANGAVEKWLVQVCARIWGQDLGFRSTGWIKSNLKVFFNFAIVCLIPD